MGERLRDKERDSRKEIKIKKMKERRKEKKEKTRVSV